MAPATILAGAQVPLLPENSEATEEPASVSGAVFNVTTSIIGAGIMSIPATMKVLGVVPAFFSIVFVAILVDISVDFLRSTYSGVSITYAALMKEAFGRPGSVGVQVCVLITNFGCLIMYFIIIGDVLSGKQVVDGEVHLGVLQEWFGIHWWNTRTFTLLFTAIFILLPLVLFRRVESLRHSSAISVLLAVVFVGICSVLSIYALFQGKTQSPRLMPQLDSQASFLNLFTAVPVIVTAFTFHFNVHAIGVELGKATDMTLAVRISLVLCCAIYFTIGIFGYLLFGDSTMDDILVNFDQSCASITGFLLNDMVRLSYAFHLMLVFPLLNFSLRSNLDELFFPKKPLLATDNRRFLFLTFVVLVLSYLAAIAIPSIWYLFQFLGSTSAVCLAFIFPGAVALRDVNGTFSKRDKIIAAAMIILAVLTSAIAISSNVISFTGKSS